MSGQPHYVVATIGRIAMTPNVPNAVPGHVELMLEVRSDSDEVLDTFPEAMLASVTQSLEEVRVTAQATHVSRAKPTDCSPLVMDAVQGAAGSLGYANMRMPSGAGHDAVYVASAGPIGMIFIPCLNGRSHCPEEWIEPEHLIDGTRVLYRTLQTLDRVVAGCAKP
jgi:N-carbamoyl-L-amino-acid hydrolase